MSVPIIISSTPAEKLPVELVGVEYLARAPKKSVLLALMMRLRTAGKSPAAAGESILSLVHQMFSKEDRATVRARLEDPEDDLDIEHIIQLAEALISEASGNPTMSPSDSSPTP